MTGGFLQAKCWPLRNLLSVSRPKSLVSYFDQDLFIASFLWIGPVTDRHEAFRSKKKDPTSQAAHGAGRGRQKITIHLPSSYMICSSRAGADVYLPVCPQTMAHTCTFPVVLNKATKVWSTWRPHPSNLSQPTIFNHWGLKLNSFFCLAIGLDIYQRDTTVVAMVLREFLLPLL